MKNTFMMLWAPGPAWVPGKTVRNQPYWAQHAAFMDRLFENGTVVLGGPFADATGSLVIVEAENEHEVADLFASDPFVVHAIFVLSSLKQHIVTQLSVWRLLIFNRNKNLTAVLAQIPEIFKKHPNFKKQIDYKSETGFRFVFHHNDDKNREIFITVLVFEMPI